MARYALPFGYVDWPDPNERPTTPSPALDDPEPTTRLTLRVPAGLRRCVEASAELEGVSTDTWIVRSLSRSVDPRLGLG